MNASALGAWSIALAVGSLPLTGCGQSQPEPASPDSPPVQEAQAAPEPMQEQADPSPRTPKSRQEASPTDEEIEAGKLAKAEKERTATAPRERRVLYRVTPQGLIVEVDGVRFKPRAEPTKKSNGGYGIRITVDAVATDDQAHTLLSPDNGPLSFAAKIYKKDGSEQAHYADERVGDDQQFVMPGSPLTFSREWPSGSVKGPLWWGQSVKLFVGLWGLGTAEEPGRPLKKFFVVEMVGGAKAQAVLSPPELDKSQ